MSTVFRSPAHSPTNSPPPEPKGLGFISDFLTKSANGNPLSYLFAEKIGLLFDLGHRTVKSVLDNSLTIGAIAVAAQIVIALPPLPSSITKKLPDRMVKLAAGPDMLKFLGLFILVKAALTPLLQTIMKASTKRSPAEKAVSEFKVKIISLLAPLLLSFVATKKVGWLGLNISLASAGHSVGCGYPTIHLIEHLTKKYFIQAYEDNKKPGQKHIGHALFRYLTK